MKVIDMHCDTISELIKASKLQINQNLRSNDLSIDLEKMQKGDYLAQCFAMYVPFNVENPFETCMMMIDRYYQELEQNKDIILPALSYNDIMANNAKGKMSAILTIEEGGVTKGSLEFLRDFYRLGVRMITLTWNFVNGVGYPNVIKQPDGSKDYKSCNKIDGLTEYGIKMVQEMNRLGIIIDVSHLSDAGFFDVVKYSSQPFVASHSNARTICNHCRNLNDEMIRVLARKGGVMGINYCADFLKEPSLNTKYGENMSMIADMVKHIKHIVNVGGIDCVGLGSDFDGIFPNLEMKNASELGKLKDALINEGFTSSDIEKIFYKNVLRLFKQVL
jgi:membrane dipeptidase